MYADIPRSLRDAVKKKNPKNGEPTVGFSITTMLQNTGRFRSRISQQRAVYSLQLAPATFYLFPRLKSELKERRFCDATDLIKNETEKLKRLSQNGFQECFQ